MCFEWLKLMVMTLYWENFRCMNILMELIKTDLQLKGIFRERDANTVYINMKGGICI